LLHCWQGHVWACYVFETCFITLRIRLTLSALLPIWDTEFVNMYCVRFKIFTLWECWWFSGFWRRVDSSVDANVSQRHTVSIFRASAECTLHPNQKNIINRCNVYLWFDYPDLCQRGYRRGEIRILLLDWDTSWYFRLLPITGW
jgi:hypothetical protein